MWEETKKQKQWFEDQLASRSELAKETEQRLKDEIHHLEDIHAREATVGDEAINAKDHTTIYGEEEPAYRRSNIEYAQREREAQRIYLYSYKCNSYN